ncbi:MAG: hypothetical protein ABJZ99_01165, partial [Lentilitoribacter sp.]
MTEFQAKKYWWVVKMSKSSGNQIMSNVEHEATVEAIKRMIRYTKKEANKDGRNFCCYFLDMALQSLEDGSEDVDSILKTKVTPLMVGKRTPSSASA